MTRASTFIFLVAFWANGCTGDPEPVVALPEVVKPVQIDVLELQGEELDTPQPLGTSIRVARSDDGLLLGGTEGLQFMGFNEAAVISPEPVVENVIISF